MRFSARFAKAVHILLMTQLMTEDCSGKITSSVVAKWLGGSPVVQRNLITQLKQAGLVTVATGKSKEGVVAARPLKEITLYDVFCAAEPDDVNAIFSFYNHVAQRCHSSKYVNEILAEHSKNAIDEAMKKLQTVTLEDVLQDLIAREKAGPHENPRVFLDDCENDEAGEKNT